MKTKCPECGGVDTVHVLSKWSLALDALLRTLTAPFDALVHPSRFSFFWRWFLPKMWKVLELLRLGKMVYEPGEKDTMRTKMMWKRGKERGVTIFHFWLFNRPLNVFMAEYQGEKILFEGLPRPKGISKSLEWMDSKEKVKEACEKNDIPTAKGGSYFFYSDVKRIFHRLRKPVIVKPTFGSRSRHTTIHISDEKELRRAFLVAKRLCPWVIVEEELQGPVFRVSLIGGEVAGVLRRDPPYVWGDGVKTVRELIEEENKNPKRSDIFHHIEVDEFVIRELEYQGLGLDSIPGREKKIALHSKVGRGQGGTNTNVGNAVHPENILLFKKLADVLADPVIGVDFIIGSMERPWQSQELCGVIECNSIPFLDLHHFPYEGEPVDAMGKLWDVVFPGSKEK